MATCRANFRFVTTPEQPRVAESVQKILQPLSSRLVSTDIKVLKVLQAGSDESCTAEDAPRRLVVGG